jgi:hypothetical protein
MSAKPEPKRAPCDARTRAQLVQAWRDDAGMDDRTAATGTNPKCAPAIVALRTMADAKRNCAEQLAGLLDNELIGDLTDAWRHLAYAPGHNEVGSTTLLDCAEMLESCESYARKDTT